jgi:hypothetical protein
VRGSFLRMACRQKACVEFSLAMPVRPCT